MRASLVRFLEQLVADKEEAKRLTERRERLTKKGLFEIIEDRLLVLELGHATERDTFTDIVVAVKEYLDAVELRRTAPKEDNG